MPDERCIKRENAGRHRRVRRRRHRPSTPASRPDGGPHRRRPRGRRRGHRARRASRAARAHASRPARRRGRGRRSVRPRPDAERLATRRWFEPRALGKSACVASSTDALHSPAGAPQPSSSVNGAPAGRPVRVKGPAPGRQPPWTPSTPDPRPPGRARPAAADAHAGPDAAAAGPEPAAHLSGARRPHPDRAGRLRGALGALRRAAGRHRRERARARADPAGELPALAAASFALSSSSCTRRSRAGCAGRSSTSRARQRPKGRRLRYAVGELLTCTRCTGAWSALGLVGPAPARPRRRADGLHGARRVGRQRHAAGRLLVAVRARQRAEQRSGRGPRPGPRDRAPRTRRVMLRTAVPPRRG